MNTWYPCIILKVIVSFADGATEDVYHGRNSKAARRFSRQLWQRMQSKLDLLNAAITLQDLQVPPSNHLEQLKGDLKDLYSIRVNDQYRIVFRFAEGNCHDVSCQDYH